MVAVPEVNSTAASTVVDAPGSGRRPAHRTGSTRRASTERALMPPSSQLSPSTADARRRWRRPQRTDARPLREAEEVVAPDGLAGAHRLVGADADEHAGGAVEVR